jgi:deazaflavin-dependent oxidoreductase (nitroreductase family)
VSNAKDTFFKAGTGIHRGIFKATKGRLLGHMGGMHALILATIGRKSGQRRETMLTAPIVEDGKVVLVASYGGDDRHPAWFLNLRDHPDVEVTIAGRTGPMRARIADADEKAELWPRITGTYKGYAGYQRKTERDIPVVILEPTL